MSQTVLRFSLFENKNDPIPKPAAMTWDEFASKLGPHDFSFTHKDALPAFSPAEYGAGKTRLAKNVLRVSFGVLDLDEITAEQLLAVCRQIDSEGTAAILYTTWSHPETLRTARLWRVRLCVPFSRPVDGAEWRLFWPALVGKYGRLADAQTKDPNRIFYGPFQPPGTERDAEFFVFRGAPLDVDKLSATRMFVENVPTGTEKITRDRLERLASRWRRSPQEWRAHMGERLSKVVRGEPFADAGERDTTVFQLAKDLAATFPTADAASIAEHFAPSLQMMGRDAPSVEQVADKIARALTAQAAEIIAEQEAELTERRLRIRQAFAHVDPTRDYPYTETELDSMSQRLECSREEMQKRWIIQRANLFYLLGPGARYSEPYTERDVINAILRDLAPAASAGVELWTTTPTGESIRKNLIRLMSEYGTVATNYVLDLRAQEAQYIAPQKLFIEAPCPMRTLTPTYDQHVASWLEILCGAQTQDVLNWIALVTDLDSPCAALMLTGAGGTGKSLLASGLARLWSTSGPTALTSAMGHFNDALTRCPLVFADEQLPKDFRGYGRTSELRDFIAARDRPYNKKHMPETRILGASRVMIAANNEDILAISENLTINDIEAIGDRFYHVPVRPEAAEFLRLCDTDGFVRGDRIARHALWLRDNHPIKREGRFLIKSQNRAFARALSTKTGIRSAVCQWLVGYIKDPRKVDIRGDYGVRIKFGRLYVTTKGVLDNWALYVQNENVPPTGRLAQAISGLSSPARWHGAKPNGGSAHYREIDTQHLYAWGESTEFATKEEIDSALAVETEERNSTPRMISPLN